MQFWIIVTLLVVCAWFLLSTAMTLGTVTKLLERQLNLTHDIERHLNGLEGLVGLTRESIENLRAAVNRQPPD